MAHCGQNPLPNPWSMGATFELAYKAYRKACAKLIADVDFRGNKSSVLLKQLGSLNLVLGAKRQSSIEPLARVLAWAKATTSALLSPISPRKRRTTSPGKCCT